MQRAGALSAAIPQEILDVLDADSVDRAVEAVEARLALLRPAGRRHAVAVR